jgi:hypothetical protein
MRRLLLKSGLLLTVILAGVIRQTPAEDFRIENRVFVEGKQTPESRSLTLFHEGMVYDFMSDPSEVTIFDKAAGRFVLLNMASQEQMELSTTEVNAFAEKLRQLANRQKDPLSRFFADPKFEEAFDAARGELSLASPSVTYRVVVDTPKHESIISQYREFSDWYTRLNAMLNPGSRPPFARLKVNEALALRQAVAREVSLAITTIKNGEAETAVLRSTHDLSPTLTPSDLDQIQKAGEARGKFKVVSSRQYEKRRK